jgi:hypothetical protein
MTIEKSELKIGAAHEIGCRLDDFLEEAVRDLHRLEGSISMIKRVSVVVEELFKSIDVEAGQERLRVDEAILLKKHFSRLKGVIDTMSSQAEGNRMAQTGKVAAVTSAVEITKKYKDVEEAKLRPVYEVAGAQEKTVEEEKSRRPEPVIKTRRLAEGLKKKSETSSDKPIDNSRDTSAGDTRSNNEDSPGPKPKKQKR